MDIVVNRFKGMGNGQPQTPQVTDARNKINNPEASELACFFIALFSNADVSTRKLYLQSIGEETLKQCMQGVQTLLIKHSIGSSQNSKQITVLFNGEELTVKEKIHKGREPYLEFTYRGEVIANHSTSQTIKEWADKFRKELQNSESLTSSLYNPSMDSADSLNFAEFSPKNEQERQTLLMTLESALQNKQANPRQSEIERGVKQMTHSALPDAIGLLTPAHWKSIGGAILENDILGKNQSEEDKRISDPRKLMKNLSKCIAPKFNDIYRNQPKGFDYTITEADEEIRHTNWVTSITELFSSDDALKNHGIMYGKPTVQLGYPILERYIHSNLYEAGAEIFSSDELRQIMTGARIYLHYSESANCCGRLQFLVTSGAGLPLFLDLSKTMDAFIRYECEGDPEKLPAVNFKVFGEDGQSNESAVIYLKVPPNDPSVKKLIAYLEVAVGDRMAESARIGVSGIGGSRIQAALIPGDETLRFSIVPPHLPSTSIEGLVTNVLQTAYFLALYDFDQAGVDKKDIKLDQLNQRAQFYTKELWEELRLL